MRAYIKVLTTLLLRWTVGYRHIYQRLEAVTEPGRWMAATP